jgi:hypothetical protein
LDGKEELQMSKIMASMILVVMLSGCVGQTEREAKKNGKSLLQLSIGLTKAEVQNIMGDPRKTESYSKDGRNIEFWLYLTEGIEYWSYDRTLRDSNFTPLAFEDGKLIGWGRNFYDQALKYEHKIEIK